MVNGGNEGGLQFALPPVPDHALCKLAVQIGSRLSGIAKNDAEKSLVTTLVEHKDSIIEGPSAS